MSEPERKQEDAREGAPSNVVPYRIGYGKPPGRALVQERAVRQSQGAR